MKSMKHLLSSHRLARTLLATACMAACVASQAATIVISSRDAPGVGFNDPTVVAPVGGNTGTTLGQQRLNVYRYVADIWEQNLQSSVPITVSAGWEALTCTATGATLGSASAWNGWNNFPNAPKADTWYPQALANKLAGVNLSAGVPDDGTGYGNVDIKTQFNVNLGSANCLPGSPFYLGLDGLPPGTQVNLVATLLHELGHGLGFSVFTTNTATGVQFQGKPSIWEGFMVDNTSGKLWAQMNDAERVASAINFRQLGWNGANAIAATPFVLDVGATPVPKLNIGGPAAGAVAGDKVYATAGFGAQLSLVPVVGELMPVVASTTAAGATGPGCGPLTALDARAVRGNIALIDRGACGFAVKVKNAQNAGARAVIIGNTAAGAFGPLGGADATITIPTLMVTFADSNLLKTALVTRSRTSSGVIATMSALPTGGQYVGTDALSRPLLYTPNPRVPGSSVSHWDTSATPSLLMEPNITPGLTTILTTPKDLTLPLLKDLGW
jgi:hypothetical protein